MRATTTTLRPSRPVAAAALRTPVPPSPPAARRASVTARAEAAGTVAKPADFAKLDEVCLK
jgi:hypothetical protein